MSSTCWRILDRAKIQDDSAPDTAAAVDLGQYPTLDVVITVHEAGTGDAPVIRLKHGIYAESPAALDTSPAIAVDLTATSTTWVRLDAYTRYVTWEKAGTISSSPTVSIDLYARG